MPGGPTNQPCSTNVAYTKCSCSSVTSKKGVITTTYTLNTLWHSFRYQYPYPADASPWTVTVNTNPPSTLIISNPPVDPITPFCRETTAALQFIPNFVAAASYSIAVDNATTIKKHLFDNTIKIYAVGISVTAGSTFESFLKAVASDPDVQYYYPTDPTNLAGIFNRIARDIPVALVQ